MRQSIYDTMIPIVDHDTYVSLICSNTGLVHSIVRKYQWSKYYEYEDLIQIGTIGLIKAAKKFDPSMDVKFSTFCYRFIEFEILKALRKEETINTTTSLDAEVDDTNGAFLYEILPANNDTHLDCVHHMCISILPKALNTLSQDEKEFIWKYYWYGYSTPALAKERNVSQMTAYRHLVKILNKLKDFYKEQKLTL